MQSRIRKSWLLNNKNNKRSSRWSGRFIEECGYQVITRTRRLIADRLTRNESANTTRGIRRWWAADQMRRPTHPSHGQWISVMLCTSLISNPPPSIRSDSEWGLLIHSNGVAHWRPMNEWKGLAVSRWDYTNQTEPHSLTCCKMNADGSEKGWRTCAGRHLFASIEF